MSEKWTTEKPTEAGIYKVWYSPMDECDVVRIALHKGVPFIAADLDDSATIQAYTHFKRIDLTPPEGADCWCDRIPEDHRPCDPCRHGATP